LTGTDDYLLQFQGDYFLFNWRKRGEDYPRYGNIFAAFSRHLARFREFVVRHELGPIIPMGFELTYVNRISELDGRTANDASRSALGDFVWEEREGRFLPAPRTIIWQAVFDLPRNFGTLTAKARPVRRISDEAPFVVLELTTRGLGSSRSFETLDEWFDCAHEWIVRGFADLTSLEVQKSAWGRENGSV
jgi:uncharacterized protein (TIGR04255 family)